MLFNKYKRKGVALITALLIMAIAATAAAYLTRQLNLSMRRTGNIVNGNQAYLYALGGESLAIIALYEDFIADKKHKKPDHCDEEWAQEVVFDVDGGGIAGKITDLSGKLNINNILTDKGKQNPKYRGILEKLMQELDINPNLIEPVFDWIDKDVNASGAYGAEDDYYLGLPTPYRTPNRPMRSISELRLIRGINEHENLEQLMSHLVAWNDYDVQINVNFASAPILVALGVDQATAYSLTSCGYSGHAGNSGLGSGIDSGDSVAEEIMASALDSSEEDPDLIVFDSLEQFYRAASIVDDNVKKNLEGTVGVISNRFLYEGEAFVDRGRSVLKSVLYRNDKGHIKVKTRTFGEF